MIIPDSSEYSKLLDEPEWKIKRHSIFKRDSYECRKCHNKTFFKNNTQNPSLLKGKILEIEETPILLQELNLSDSRFDKIRYNITFTEQDEEEVRKSEILSPFIIDKEEKKTFLGKEIYYFDINVYDFNRKMSEEKAIFRIVNTSLIDFKKLFYIRKLEAHHIYYIRENKPWEYPDDALITLCDSCHTSFHQNCKTPIQNLHGDVIDYLPKGINHKT